MYLNFVKAQTNLGALKMEFYGIYKNVRDAAWQCLIDFNINSLPVDLKKIACKANIKILKNGDVNILDDDQDGMYIKANNKWYLIYRDNQNIGRCRYTVAHEMGHIFSGHDIKNAQTEKEADIFASRLLAPACVLWGLNIRNANDIQDICNISKESSLLRAERMAVLYKRNKFLSSPLERKVYDNFRDFINKYKDAIN